MTRLICSIRHFLPILTIMLILGINHFEGLELLITLIIEVIVHDIKIKAITTEIDPIVLISVATKLQSNYTIILR